MSLYLLACLFLGDQLKRKMYQKVEKVHNFFDELDSFEFGKNWKFDDPHPLDLIWEKIVNVMPVEHF